MSWPTSRTIEPGPSAYSDLAVLDNGTILCFYESGVAQPKIKEIEIGPMQTLHLLVSTLLG